MVKHRGRTRGSCSRVAGKIMRPPCATTDGTLEICDAGGPTDFFLNLVVLRRRFCVHETNFNGLVLRRGLFDVLKDFLAYVW